jgi:hypothetical protein
MELSLRWARRCQGEFARLENPNALFGIVQGGMFENLREESLAALVDMDFPGYAIGGVSVGEPKEEMLHIMGHTPHRLPANKPRYLMGVGTPEDLVQGVADGVDMFDCVMPTRNARNGTMFTRFGDLKMRNARHKSDPQPVDPSCTCHACAGTSGVSLERRRARRLQPRLPAPPGPLRRNARADAVHHPQPALLPEPDDGDSRGAGRGHVHRISRAVQVGARARRLTRGAGPSYQAGSGCVVGLDAQQLIPEDHDLPERRLHQRAAGVLLRGVLPQRELAFGRQLRGQPLHGRRRPRRAGPLDADDRCRRAARPP